jgi:hypothetical protein
MQQDVGGAGRAWPSVGAYDTVGGEGHFDFVRFEPFVEKIGRALGEDLNQADDLFAAQFVQLA